MGKKLVGNSICKYNEKIFFTVFEINIIGCMDIKTGETSYFFGPDEEAFTQFMLWGDICVWNNKVIVEPYMAKSVWSYDLEDKKWEKICTPILPKKFSNYRFVGCQLFGDNLYMVGHNYSNICCLNIDTGEEHDILSQNDNDAPGWIRFYGQSMCRKNDCFYVANHLTNHIVKIYFENNRYEWIMVGENRSNVGILNLDDYLWIIPTSGNNTLIRMGEKDNSIKEFPFKSDISNIWGAAGFKKKIYMYGPDEESVIFNTEDCSFSKMGCRIRFAKNIEDYIFLWDNTGLLTIRNQDETFIYDVEINDNLINGYLREHVNDLKIGICEDIIKESGSFGLSNMIELLS